MSRNDPSVVLCVRCLLFSLGEGASPFIDEGDGLTSERKRVCVLLSLVAHAVGYKTVCQRPQYC